MATQTVDRSVNTDDLYNFAGTTGNNVNFVALQSGSLTYQTNLTGIATWLTAAGAVSSNWQSVCYGNNIVVAVSSTTGTVCQTSPAGLLSTWTQRTMPTSASWYAIAFGGNIFASVTGGASTVAASSIDGCAWTERTLPTSGDWRSLTYGNDRFVATSYGSTNSVYSTNGTAWTAGGALPASRNWTSICYGEGTFVAIASGTDKGAYSIDGGVNWIEMTMPSSSNWRSVCYGNGTFVAVSNTSGTVAASSVDGINWIARTMPATAAWVGVAYGNNVFTAVSTTSTNAATSSDGFTWRAIVMLSQSTTCICATPTVWNSGDTLAITNNATVTVNTNQTKFWSAVTLTNGKLLIENNSTDIEDAIRFTMGQTTTDAAAAITPASGIGDVEISGNWIELGTGDGTSGQEMTAPFTDYIPALWVETASGAGTYEVWLNVTGDYGDANNLLSDGLSAVGKEERGKFFIQESTAIPYGPKFLNATSGSRAQKLLSVTSTTGIQTGASVKGAGITAGSVVNKIYSSTLIELQQNTTNEVSTDWASVCFDGTSKYVAVSGTGSNVAAYSTNAGVDWTKTTLPFVADWTSVTYGATTGLYVAVASNGSVGVGFCATSSDGITWTQRALPSTQNWTSVASNGTSYVAVGQTSASAVTTAGAYSADGVTWAATVMSSQIWNAVAYGGGRYVAVGTGTVTNYDADGAGTWSVGATVTSATYRALAYNGSRWFVVSGSTTGSQYKDDPTTGAFTAGITLPLATARGVTWDGSNFVVVYTTNAVNSSRSANGTAITNTTLTGTQIGSWNAVCNNGTTLVAVSGSGTLRSYAMTSTDSGATWTVRTGMVADVTLVCVNPYKSQLTDTVLFGDNLNGNKVPTGAKVRCPNIMFTTDTPANVKVNNRTFGANMVMTAGGSLTANICLFDESYNNFQQSEILSLVNCGFSRPPLITECYGLTINHVGFALEPVRRYFVATTSAGWTTYDARYGVATTNIWNYINEASITDLNMAVGQMLGLHANQTGSTATTITGALRVDQTEGSVWTDIRFYALNVTKNFQTALNFNSLFNNNTITNLESYGLAPFYLGTSSGNNITNITFSEDMWNGYSNMASAYRIGNEPVAGIKLVDDTRYYIKTRSFRDWTDRTQYYEGREVSSTPFIGSKWFPQALSVYNSGPRAVTFNWVRRAPESTIMLYEIFRSTSASFTPDSSNKIFGTLTAATVSYTNGYVAPITATASPVRTITFAQAGRTITLSGAGAGSFTTAGYVAGGNVVVAGTVSNNGTYTILSFTATVITLTTNHTNLVNETAPNGATLNGQVPSNATTYYYRFRKYDSVRSGITNSSGTAGQTTLTTSQNFNTGLGTITMCDGTSGQFKIYIDTGNATNFYSGFVTAGMQIAGTGVGVGATVVSVDSPWEITVSVANSSTFTDQTLTLGACAGMYVYGPGLAQPTKVSSVDSATQITVDTPFIANFSGSNTLSFMHGTDSPSFEVYVNGATSAAFNYLAYSDDFTNAAWVKTNLTATANQRVAPLDIAFSSNAAPTGIADRLTSTNGNSTAVQTITYLKIGTAYIFSVYINTDITQAQQTVEGSISVNTTVPATQSFSATSKWQRITRTFTATATTHTFTIDLDTPGTYIYAATAQVNIGGTALAPITNAALAKFMIASGGRTLSFATGIDGLSTITGSSGSFITDGFVLGDTILVSGSASNDGTYVIHASTAITATVITLNSAYTLTTEAGLTSGSIVGATLPAAAQELTAAYSWSRSTGGNDKNQGIELTLAALPTGTHYTEIYLGTASGFTPTDYNRAGYVNMPGSPAPIIMVSSNENTIQTVSQLGSGGLSGALLTLTGSSNNKFFDFETDFNFSANTASVLNVSALSNNNIFDDFTVRGWRNYIASWTPFTFQNNSSGVILQNINFDNYDFPIYTSATNSALGIIMKGVSGGNSEPLTTATTYTIGTTTDGVGVAFTTVYDTMFHEMYVAPTRGELSMRFNASAEDDPPYTVVSGNPAFSNSGRLYFRTAGDSMEFTWPYKIHGVSSFRNKLNKKSGADLGSNLDVLESLLIEYSIDTGSGYSAYQEATPANLAAESVSTETGFNLKLKITARPGMLFTSQSTAFVLGETILGQTSGATAVVDEVFDLGTTGTIILSNVTGTFLPGEVIRDSGNTTTRATNVATNTQFALFPSFNSYIDGLEIYTNTVGPSDYPGQTVNIVLTNVVSGSRYYVYKTSDLTLLGSGTAAGSTVTISDVAYVGDFGITVRVRKATSAPKYVPLETQATVNASGASVYIGQAVDTIA